MACHSACCLVGGISEANAIAPRYSDASRQFPSARHHLHEGIKVKVIYIAGTSHSGSTLLSLMLNAHPDIVSVGELHNLSRQFKISLTKQVNRCCSCGADSLWNCDFWSDVDERVRQLSGKSLVDHNVLDYANVNKSGSSNAVVFKAISDVSGKQLIVDSSKQPNRMSYLTRLGELQVYPIHLIRNPEGQINSVLKKRRGLLKPILRYELVHAQIRRALKAIPHNIVHYEDLVLNPESTLRTVLHPLGLKFDRQQLGWAGAIKHNIAGNKSRWSVTSQLILDEGWKHSLTPFQKHVIGFATLISRQATRPTGYVGASSLGSDCLHGNGAPH